MNPLRLAFLGTPAFSLPCLAALSAAGHEIAAVYCQPPRPAGRGHKLRPSPVQAEAEAQGWPVRTPTSLSAPETVSAFQTLGLDAAVVVAYGLILPAPILAGPRLGCLNLHASLLPRWRGAAPIQRAILAGDEKTGVTIMQMDEGLDTGPILSQESLGIAGTDNGATLHDALAALGARMMVEALAGLAAGRLAAQPQPREGITYAAKLARAEGRLDWRLPARDLERRLRAFHPWPGAYADIPVKDGQERIKVLAAEVVADAGDSPAGQVRDAALTVACGADALRLTRVQRPGRAAMSGEEFLRGCPLAAGTRLALPGPETAPSAR